MANAIKKLTATTPRGIFTRKTHRTYTHVVVFLVDGEVVETAWSGRLDLAQKAQPSWRMYKGLSKEVYPVDQ